MNIRNANRRGHPSSIYTNFHCLSHNEASSSESGGTGILSKIPFVTFATRKPNASNPPSSSFLEEIARSIGRSLIDGALRCNASSSLAYASSFWTHCGKGIRGRFSVFPRCFARVGHGVGCGCSTCTIWDVCLERCCDRSMIARATMSTGIQDTLLGSSGKQPIAFELNTMLGIHSLSFHEPLAVPHSWPIRKIVDERPVAF